MDFGVLGALLVTGQDAGTLTVGPPKLRLLLAALLCRPGAVVSGGTLAEALWRAGPPPGAAGTIRVYVHQLRRVVGEERLVRAAGGYQLLVGPDELDSERFRALGEQGRKAAADGRPGEAVTLLRQALGLWRGPAFAEFQDAELIRAAAAALDELRLDVLEECVECELLLGRHAELCAEVRELAAEHPLRENLRAQLMLALARSGRQAEATAVFHDTRRQLAEDYGLDPGPRLRAMYQRILDNDPGLAYRRPVTPLQLPRDTARFAGRADLLAALDALVPDERGTAAPMVVTVVGMAGVGKTTLAVHWAHRVAARFADGQLFVDLRGFGPATPVRPIEALAGLLRGLGVAPEAVPLDVQEAAALYRSLLAGRRVLVVLDNAASAEQVRPLLPGGHGCLALVTSRHRLSGLIVHEGARRLNLDVLSPAEARELLAGLLAPDRPGEPPSALEALAQVCGHLPLALRIVAAQLLDAPFRAVEEHAALLRTGRLRGMAVDGDEDAMIRAAFDASYEALPAGERRMFRLLGLVPTGDIGAPAAAALAGVPVEEAARLLDRLTAGCLLANPAAGRWTVHDLLRWYAAERATADPGAVEAFQRFCDWHLHCADAAARHLFRHGLRLPLPPGPPPPSTLRFDSGPAARDWLEQELANLATLVVHCAGHGPKPVAWLLADALRGVFARLRRLVDWTTTAEVGLGAARRDGDDRAVVAMLHSAAHAAFTAGRATAAMAHLTEAAELARRAGWAMGEVAVTGNLGVIRCDIAGQLPVGVSDMARAMRQAERWGMPDIGNSRRSGLSFMHLRMGYLRTALRGALWALELARRADDLSTQAGSHHNAGRAYWELGLPDRAAEHFRRSLAVGRQVGHQEVLIRANLGVALIETIHAGRGGEGLARARTALAQAREIADRWIEAEALNALAAMHAHLGEHAEAARLSASALSVTEAIGARLRTVEPLLGLARAHCRLGELDTAREHADRARSEATAMFLTVDAAHAVAVLAEVALRRGDPATAARHARRALRAYTRSGHRPGERHARGLLAAARRRR